MTEERRAATVCAATTYRTTGGWDAHVWYWSKNALGEECWCGTEAGIGFGTWDAGGRSLSGDPCSDLVLEALPDPAVAETEEGGG